MAAIVAAIIELLTRLADPRLEQQWVGRGPWEYASVSSAAAGVQSSKQQVRLHGPLSTFQALMQPRPTLRAILQLLWIAAA